MKPLILLLLLGLAQAVQADARRQCEQWADEDEVPAESRSAYLTDCLSSLDEAEEPTPNQDLDVDQDFDEQPADTR